MNDQNVTDLKLPELERKSNELTCLLFALCENRLAADTGKPSPEYLALTASALALQRAIITFLAVEKLCA